MEINNNDNINKLIDNSISIKYKRDLFILCLIFAFLYDIFFNNKYVGISYFIFNTSLIVAFLYINRDKIAYNKKIGAFILISASFLSLTFGIYSNPVLQKINGLLVPILIVLSNIIMTEEKFDWSIFIILNKLVKRIVVYTFSCIPKPFHMINMLLKSRKNSKMSDEKKNIIKGILISIPLLIFIVILLSSADMVFHYYTSQIISKLEIKNFGRIWSHFFTFIFIFIYIFSYIWSYNYNYIQKESIKEYKWKSLTIITITILVNIIYILFTIIQFSYLYGGLKSLPANYTYSEYARKGFFELVIVTIINFIIVVLSIKNIDILNDKYKNILNTSLSLLIIFTFTMLFSAHFKLRLYEAEYGFTYLRVFVQAFIYLLFLLLIITLYGIWSNKVNIIKNIVILSIIAYIILNFMNVDKFIAKKNIELYYKKNSMDLRYLTQLSFDAIPYIIEMKDNVDYDLSRYFNDYLDNKSKVINKEIKWYEFNYSVYKVKK